MTDREAIEVLQYVFDNAAPHPRELEALPNAIAALQEREERSKGCVLCNPNKLCGTCMKMLDYDCDGIGDDKCSATILEEACADYTPMAACPNCGRPLKGAEE